MHCSPVYEFHDINAGNFAKIADILKKSGTNEKWNLMVVPFSEGIQPGVLKAFSEQLLEWKKEGHNLYLHGYMHKANANLKRSLRGRLALRLTNSEAEFAGLSKEDSKMLLEKALQEWQKLNAGEANGFVPPAWYGSKMLFYLCKNLGFENYNGRFVVWNKDRGFRFSLPFSTAGLPRPAIPIVNLCEKIYLKVYKIFSFLPMPRIARHPMDGSKCPH
jgi:peptidoglycan/xylan/chitin deacetylase (PgdA/CDA1 family)